MRIMQAVGTASAAWLLATAAFAQGTCPANENKDLKIELIRLGRDKVTDGERKVDRVYGDIGVNGQNIGRFYENPEKMIATGTYQGVLRYRSDKSFVQSSCGEIARDGDFLLEIVGVKRAGGKPRTAILLHPGSLPSHSEGCILMGPRKRGTDGKPLPLDADSPLVKLRRAFYGTDNPIACPDRGITVTVSGG